MLFRFVNSVIKIISSQEFIGRFTPPCINRWPIWYNEWTEMWWYTIDHGVVGDEPQFKLNAILYRKPMQNFKMISNTRIPRSSWDDTTESILNTLQMPKFKYIMPYRSELQQSKQLLTSEFSRVIATDLFANLTDMALIKRNVIFHF